MRVPADADPPEMLVLEQHSDELGVFLSNPEKL